MHDAGVERASAIVGLGRRVVVICGRRAGLVLSELVTGLKAPTGPVKILRGRPVNILTFVADRKWRALPITGWRRCLCLAAT